MKNIAKKTMKVNAKGKLCIFFGKHIFCSNASILLALDTIDIFSPQFIQINAQKRVKLFK